MNFKNAWSNLPVFKKKNIKDILLSFQRSQYLPYLSIQSNQQQILNLQEERKISKKIFREHVNKLKYGNNISYSSNEIDYLFEDFRAKEESYIYDKYRLKNIKNNTSFNRANRNFSFNGMFRTKITSNSNSFLRQRPPWKITNKTGSNFFCSKNNVIKKLLHQTLKNFYKTQEIKDLSSHIIIRKKPIHYDKTKYNL